MGIIHFAGLGRSPGAVTVGLSYLKHKIENNVEEGDIVESVVIFTSPEIKNGSVKSYPEIIYNKYMERTPQANWPKNMDNSLCIVAEFLFREIGNGLFYVCESNINDYDACLNTVAKALLKFHPPGKTGKHIWANITGGTNVLNAALMQTAYLSGLIPQLYYTFIADNQKDGIYLQPFSKKESEFYFRKIPVLKTTFDNRYYYILEELNSIDIETQGKWTSSQDLLSRLKQKHSLDFGNLSLKEFQRDYLNIIPEIQRKGSRNEGQEDKNRLNEYGKEVLKTIRSPLIKTLLRREKTQQDEISDLIKDLNIDKLKRREK